MARSKKTSIQGGKKVKETKLPKDRLLPKFTTFFFSRPRITALLWVALIAFGALSYTTLLKREGFPSVNVPIAIVNGTYFVNDPAKVDSDVAKRISDIALKDEDVSTVQTQSADNFFTVQIQYKEDVDAKIAAKELEQQVKESGDIPQQAQIQYDVPYFGATGGDIEQIDIAVSFYSKEGNPTTVEIAAKAEEAAKWLNDQKITDVKTVFVKNPFENVTNPATGQVVNVQRSFDRFGTRQQDKTNYYNSVIIGFTKNDGADVIKLDEHVREALHQLEEQPQFKGYTAEVSASFAPQIEENISELQRVLLEGLIAVLIVGSIVIAIRASIITVISMITVLVATIGLLYLIGYTLNVITLFALILGLALIVDDTIIMVEAIDAARRKDTDPKKAVKDATRKISRAMVAATLTASLCFAPLLFVGGILGSFIRAIPITIISSLIISLLVALIFIPFFARFLLLGKKQMGPKGDIKEVSAGFEAKLASFIAAPMMWAKGSIKRLFGVGLTAVFIGFAFLVAGLFIAKDVVFNIFPPTKDTNGIVLSVNFPHNTDIEKAQAITTEIDRIAADTIGTNFVQGSYYNSGTAQNAMQQIQIISYSKRDITSPQIVDQLKDKFKNFKDAQVIPGQLDLGPPAASFIVEIEAIDREAAFKAAQDMAAYLTTAELERINGTKAKFTNVTVSSVDQYVRTDGKPIVTVSAGFNGDDTTTLVSLAQTEVNEEFDAGKLKSYGLSEDAINYNLGQESENQDSFKTLALAFPILLIVMFILLALEFKSFLQPLLIFLAIPFSIFGVMLGLRITDNAISFFTMLGFFALIGLSIKNTILLTDYANQARRSGMGSIDSAHAALEERFRPLFATSVTAVVSLIPLALASPFWQGLAVVLIFGLLSSTFLVVTVFPYYYLGAEYLRMKISPKHFFIWLLVTLAVTIALAQVIGVRALVVLPLSILLVILQVYFRRRLSRP
jgi:multidrug efflux pump subunit AcrB